MAGREGRQANLKIDTDRSRLLGNHQAADGLAWPWSSPRLVVAPTSAAAAQPFLPETFAGGWQQRLADLTVESHGECQCHTDTRDTRIIAATIVSCCCYRFRHLCPSTCRFGRGKKKAALARSVPRRHHPQLYTHPNRRSSDVSSTTTAALEDAWNGWSSDDQSLPSF